MFSYDNCINCNGLRCTVCTGPIKSNFGLWNSQQRLVPLFLLSPIKSTEIKYLCPNCEASLNIYDKYCHECGKQLDWEDV